MQVHESLHCQGLANDAVRQVLDKKLATLILAVGLAPAALIGIGLYFLR